MSRCISLAEARLLHKDRISEFVIESPQHDTDIEKKVVDKVLEPLDVCTITIALTMSLMVHAIHRVPGVVELLRHMFVSADVFTKSMADEDDSFWLANSP